MKSFKYRCAGAYTVGRSHIKKNLPCQDRVAVLKKNHSSGSFYAIALADGAGSYKNSQIGAEFISTSVLKYINSNFTRLFYHTKNPQKSILSFIEKSLKNFSKEKNIDVKELSSTLLFLAVKNEKAFIGHIGDGVIGILNKKGKLEVISHPENGNFANSTYFTTTFDYKNRLRLKRIDFHDKMGAVLLSDGAAESLYDKRNKTLAFICSNIINWLETNEEEKVQKALYENLQNVISKKTVDDCSIAIMRKMESFD